jgi:DNA topoisomerase I
VDDSGRVVRDRRTLDRVEALRVPPAWTDVHIARSARASIQAWGYDAAGRKQYRYHAGAVARGELRKYHRVRQMARELPRIRRRLARDAASRTPTRDMVAAAAVRLLGEGFFRPGSERYAREHGTHGLTTLRKSHVSVEEGCIFFRYVGKGSIRQRQCVANHELSVLVAKLLRSPGPRLFRWRDESGRWQDLSARDLNVYLQERVGVPNSAKDFRTWGGTLRAATILAELGPATNPTQAKRNVATTMRLVAAELGNTPAICRKSYVHPIVIARYLDDGETIELPPRARASRGRAVAGHSPEEKALIAFLDEHFPERRRSPRGAARETGRVKARSRAA